MSITILKRQDFLAQIPGIEATLKNNPNRLPYDLIGVIAASSGCPIVMVCQFVGELTGFTPELLSKMERMKAYHGVEIG